jgi:hypothetical protein
MEAVPQDAAACFVGRCHAAVSWLSQSPGFEMQACWELRRLGVLLGGLGALIHGVSSGREMREDGGG